MCSSDLGGSAGPTPQAQATGTVSIAIGPSNNAGTVNGARASTTLAIALGSGTVANGSASPVALGAYTASSGDCSIGIGTAVGPTNNGQSTGTSSLSIGSANTAGTVNAARALSDYAVALGPGANVSTGVASTSIGKAISTTAANAVTLGDTFTASTAGCTTICNNAAEQFRTLPTATGNFTNRVVTSTVAGASPAPTAAQFLGGIIYLTNTAGTTLTLGTAGMTGTQLSAAVPGVYVGCHFQCVIIGNDAAGANISVSGTHGTASNGITPYGNLGSAGLRRPITFDFINTGANTWDVISNA